MARTDERGGPQTRARILEVAAGLFLERGYDAVTVAEVARAAGVSSVTVFKHFPRKEDLFLDRADDAVDLLRAAVRDRPAGVDVLTSLRATAVGLADAAHPLSGLDERSLPFFRTVAASPALVARAREITADLQRVLAEELAASTATASASTADAPADDVQLVAALFTAGYAAVVVETARRRLAGEPADGVDVDHRARLERLFAVLRGGFTPG